MKRSTKLWIALGALLVLLQILYIVVSQFFFKPYVLTGDEGMEPGLNGGDYIFVRSTKNIARGDLVCYSRPNRNAGFVKRAMALAGDTIEIKGGRLLLNGAVVEEPYLFDDDEPVPDFGPLRVPPGHLFALGDNRSHLKDSREHGPIPTKDVIGRVVYVMSWGKGFHRPARVPPRTAPARPRG